eukprot:3910936-Prorocentrum_lima.AAC.1
MFKTFLRERICNHVTVVTPYRLTYTLLLKQFAQCVGMRSMPLSTRSLSSLAVRLAYKFSSMNE